MEKSGLTFDLPEKATTTLVLDKDQLDALLVAINDSMAKANFIIDESLTEEEIKALAKKYNTTTEVIEQTRESAEALAEFQLSVLGSIYLQIKEVMPEVEETDKIRQHPFIIKP